MIIIENLPGKNDPGKNERTIHVSDTDCLPDPIRFKPCCHAANVHNILFPGTTRPIKYQLSPERNYSEMAQPSGLIASLPRVLSCISKLRTFSDSVETKGRGFCFLFPLGSSILMFKAVDHTKDWLECIIGFGFALVMSLFCLYHIAFHLYRAKQVTTFHCLTGMIEVPKPRFAGWNSASVTFPFSDSYITWLPGFGGPTLKLSYYLSELTIAKIENIHSILIKELAVDRNIRHRRIGITRTNYRPLDNGVQIREALEATCKLINSKKSIFEKALLLLLLISYIQPFNDGNKRTARIVSNAILIANRHCPLPFRTVDSIDYKKAMLLFYEQNNLYTLKKYSSNNSHSQ